MIRRREMAINHKKAIEPLVIYENGAVNSKLNTTIVNTVITSKVGTAGGMNTYYNESDRLDWHGIYAGVDATEYAGRSGICSFTTSTPITIPEGYTSINAELILRDKNSTERSAFGLNLWKTAGAYNTNNLLSINTFHGPNEEAGATIELTDELSELRPMQSLVTYMYALPLFQVKRTGKIPAGSYYIGGYIRRTVSTYGTNNFVTTIVKKIWLE